MLFWVYSTWQTLFFSHEQHIHLFLLFREYLFQLSILREVKVFVVVGSSVIGIVFLLILHNLIFLQIISVLIFIHFHKISGILNDFTQFYLSFLLVPEFPCSLLRIFSLLIIG